MEQIIPPGSTKGETGPGPAYSLKTPDKNILDHLPFAVVICDNKGDISYFNQEAGKLAEFQTAGLQQTFNISEFFDLWKINGKMVEPSQIPPAIALQSGKSFQKAEAEVKLKNGDFFPIIITIEVLKDENDLVAGLINIIQDISEVKKTEQALKETEAKLEELRNNLELKAEEKAQDIILKNIELRETDERYHKMVDEVEDYAIIYLDKNGLVQNWNKGAEKIKGYAESDIVGKSFELFYLPEDRAAGLPKRIINEAFTKGKALHEGWRLRKDGTMFWGSIVLTALHDHKGSVIGFSKVTRDLTMQKIAEDKLKKYTQQLEFQNKELEQFAYAASHDMKEPLRKIQLYNCFIAENEANILDDKSREYLSRSIRSVRKMGNLIDDLLSYSKASIIEEDLVKTDLNEIIDEILLQHKDEVENPGIKIKHTPLPIINGIPFQLKQLFDNLVSNAIKYKHPDRDLQLEIGSEITKGSEIGEPGIDNNKFFYRIYVRDNGIGFNQQFGEKVFEIFQRLTNTSGISGSGIGLAISKRIVQNHKGKIRVSSREGVGSEFEIFLPKYL